jgi:Alginate export
MTNVNCLGGQFRRLYLRQRVIFENISTLARLAGRLVIFLLCLFATDSLKAQTPDPSPTDAPQPEVRPPLSPFPRYEDWSFLRDPAKRVDPYDRLKFIPLNASGTIYVTLGLENRTEFQYLNSNAWGAGPQDHTGYVLERLMPDVDVRLGDHARVFITLAFDEVGGKKAGPRPGIDKDGADGHEGFVEFGGNLHALHPGWDVIIGRQEIVLGTGRLLDDNEGMNVRSAFDGIRIGYDKPKGRIDLIAVKPGEINPGAWDDMPNPKITLWGLYASNVRWRRRFMTDVYFPDYDAKSATYGSQSGREQRRMVGGRYFNRLPGEPPSAFRPPGRCHQRRQRTAGYARNLERVFSARSVFRAEVRADWAGKFVIRSAPVRVPSLAERNRNFRMDMVLAREYERRALQL